VNRFAASYASLLIALMPGVSPGKTLWRGDFETKDLSQWSGTLNAVTGPRENITIVDSPVFEGKYSTRIVVHPDDIFANGHNRVEVRYEGKRTGEGQTTFFSWRFRLIANAGIHEDIAYWETGGPEYRQSMAFYLDPADYGTQLGFRVNRPDATEYWRAPVRIGEWHQLAMRVFWSENAGKGKVSVWFDGERVVNDAAGQTKPNGADLFIQMGFHRDSSQQSIETIYLDDAVEGTVLDDVLPSFGTR
jgi:hypothetical protein